ncbi:ATP-binding cassette domain-containing protein [Micromonospora fluostatini]|uniref:ATP-binding cassette domain-containing protein n=1 Tax=Micromonospora fluostatini TaxID=1629071 RepID=A0ABY2DJY2_9ACTN|nr:ATP-binding cassette domain-containing protein [Micromonospora fluostatini]
MGDAVTTTRLTRYFRRHAAVDGLDLRVPAGEIVGLIGPNGAGKTTTIRMLTTLLRPSAGQALVCGLDVRHEAVAVRRLIGYVPQEKGVRHLLTGRESLEIEADLHHIPRRRRDRRVAELLDLVGLLADADRMVSDYSGGMQKRLDLACGLLHAPELLILDEPTLGLDVVSRHRVWDYVRRLRAEGRAVLLATNYLDEADRLCDRITIIDRGREVVTGTPADLKRDVGADVVRVSTGRPEVLRSAIGHRAWVRQITIDDAGDLHVHVDDAATALPDLVRDAVRHGVDLTGVHYHRPTLDDVFLRHTGRVLAGHPA